MEYEEIVKAIEEAPLTQIPAIMMKAIQAAQARKVFKDDKTFREVVIKVADRAVGDGG
ncbi:MAG: hypothetical protein KAV87_55470 [Desulfobacteraceae bacterium]|nr:hypothetical protein [Desulfobacteraceae bacterium]